QGGQFNEYGIVTHEGVARVFSDGTLDTNFNNTTNFNTPLVRCLALQSDGKAIVGGNFFTWATSGRTNLVRLYGNNYPAEIITQPKSINVAVGTNVTFFTDVSNPTQVDYQWRYDGQDILGATDNEYSIFNAQLADAGTYSVFVNSGVGGTTSSNAVLQVGIPPAITQQPTPTSLAVTQGQTATFTAAASGTPLNYYWLLNGKSLAGTNATLTVTNVLPNQAGNYTLVASNFLGTATSAPAALSVLYPNNIVNGPSSQSVAVGGTALFTVSASGNPLNYQWLKSGSPIPGATGSSFQITNVMFSDAASYSVTVSNQFNSQTSSVATLSVGYPPSITLQPTNVTANLGDTVSFTSAASGTGPLSYQWLFNNNPIANQTASNLTLTNVQIGNIGNYALSVSSPFGSAISSNAFLNLNGYPSNLYFGLIAYYPFSGNANDATGNGNNGTVSGAALTQDRFGNPGMAYQFDGVSNYIYCSIVNIPAGSAPRALSLWAQSDATNTAGANPAWWGSQQSLQGFGIEAYGTPYLWAGQLDGGVDVVYSDAVVDTNWHQLVLTYDGATLAIAVDGVQQNNLGVTANTSISGLYIGSGLAANYFPGAVDEVRIYNRALSTNDVAQLYQLESGLPLIQQQPQSLSLVVGQTANFNVQVASIGSLSYQWYYSNAPLANATNALLTIPSVQMTNAGAYFVVVSNTLGSATSGVANLTVGTPPQMALVHFGPNNLPMIQMSGTSGFNYMVQTTTNLTPPIVWQTIATIPADTNGNWTFIDTNPPSLGSRFYRVAAP
ncbi:MAG TPA: immunoglobulin domain-containing protein, partial [Verrucomicrobiae bacterium]|nr:immunoglobulin domain-containing protein [Verrucomicrobiae bacterium]